MKILITERQLRLLTEEKSIFTSRRMEDREERHKDIIYKKIQDYIKNGSKYGLDLSETPITSLPDNLTEVNGSLYLINCFYLTSLPNNLTEVHGSIYLDNCTSLTSLPNNLRVHGNLYLKNCTSLTSLPDNLSVGAHLNLENCTSLTSLPNNLKAAWGLRLTNTPLTKNFDRYEIKDMIISKGGSVGGMIMI